MLLADVLAELEGGCGIKIADHEAVTAVGHDAEEFAVFAEHEVAARGIKFAKQAFEEAVVELDVFGRGQIDLKAAFAVITFACADQNGVLEFKGVGRSAIDFRAQLSRFRLVDRDEDESRVLKRERERSNGDLLGIVRERACQ